MGATAVAVMIRHEKDIVKIFQSAGAVNAGGAKPLGALGLEESRHFARLEREWRGSGKGEPGTWYLDEAAWTERGTQATPYRGGAAGRFTLRAGPRPRGAPRYRSPLTQTDDERGGRRRLRITLRASQDQYARFRPGYPFALFDFLADHAPDTGLAWDCGTGTGIAALPLAERFDTWWRPMRVPRSWPMLLRTRESRTAWREKAIRVSPTAPHRSSRWRRRHTGSISTPSIGKSIGY